MSQAHAVPQTTIALLIASLSVCHLLALDSAKSITQYVHRTWQLQDGLPQSSITALLQCKRGYIWVGTQNGLARFDGVTFTVFNRNNSDAFTSDYVTSLLEDHLGRLWVGTRRGVVCYSNGEFKRPNTEVDLLDPVVNVLAEDAEGTLWIGTDGRGLNFMRHDTWHAWVPSGTSGPHNVMALHCDNSGQLWIGCRSGLYTFKNGQCHAYPKFEEDQIRSIISGTGATLWLATYRGIFILDGDNVTALTTAHGLSENMINTLFLDSEGCLWIGTEAGGVNRYQNGVFTHFSQVNGLTNDSVSAFLMDIEGNLWVGTYTGLNMFRDGKFTTVTTIPGATQNVVWTVFQDHQDIMYFTTNNGLSLYRDGHFQLLTTKDGLSSNYVSTTFKDHQHRLWVGTYDQGLNILENGVFHQITSQNFLSHDSIRSIQEDSRHTIWVATYGGGVCQLKDGKWSHITTKEGLSSDFVFTLCEAKNGGMWVGTDGVGLNKVEKEQITAYMTSEGLSSDVIMALYEDDEGILWIGTEHDGLNRFEDGEFSSFSTKDGLGINSIFQILEDDAGVLWLGGYDGVCAVPKKMLTAFAEGRIPQVSSSCYREADGMKSRECNGGFQPAAWKTRNGTLWFATLNGVAVVDPADLKTNSIAPPVHIEQISLDEKPAPLHEVMEIQPTVHKIEFYYTALSFSAPEKIEFRYRLEGFDTDWINPENRLDRIATYTNLPPGQYDFLLTACNNDGLWNELGLKCTLRVIAPFWKKPWFTLLAAIVFAAFSYVTIHLGRTYLTLITFWKRKSFIGHYRIAETIGLGGMGTVYKAHHVMDKTKTVAIKVVRESFALDPEQKKRFLNEASIMDQFDHPHIVKVIERGEYNQQFFFAMEYLTGQPLSELIEQTHPIPFQTVKDILCQIADALTNIHSKGIVHRDLKPENIMLIEKDGRKDFVKLLDFGLAKSDSLTRFTATGKVLGTVQYISPEQILEGEATSASDIYALGIIFYEMVTGMRPFQGETAITTIKSIIDSHPKEPASLREDLPGSWNLLILKMIGKDKMDRPDAVAFLRQMEILP